uniref:Uncharacterized protein n=2 Tax=Amphimedon queenslandica TaxID=400682 RepID=A0A1X7VBH3_AMPQE
MAEKYLKVCGEPSIPGLALPKAFEELEKQFDCVANVCRLKGSHESQTTGILLVCHELQRLLRLSFVENGILASRIEILSRYQDDCIKKMEKRLKEFETEQKVTRRYIRALRKRQYKYEKVKTSKGSEWWMVDVTSSDYDSLCALSRMNGNPSLEFMLRLNQLLLDFVKDPYTNELLLPPMGSEERAELSKLASLYKLRCRFNKSTQVATSTLIKARQTCVPASGEVDLILNTFTKKMRDGPESDTEAAKEGGEKSGDDTATGSSMQSNTANNSNVTDTESTPTNTATNTASMTPPVIGDGAKGRNENGGVGGNIGASGGRGGGRGGRAGKGRGGLVDKGDGLPSYMLTPVSSMGTATITLEGEFIPGGGGGANQRTAKSSSPTTDIGHVTRPTPSVRVTKLDNRPFVQVVPPPQSSSAGVVKKGSSSSLDSNTATTSLPAPLQAPLSLPSTSSPSTSSTAAAYTNLLTASGSASPAALHMALLMQSQQQLRALTAQVNAGGQGLSPLTLPLPPVPPSAPIASPPTSLPSTGGMTAGVSTVLATPLPKSLSTATPPVSGGQQGGRKGGGGGGGGTKRESTASAGSNSKRYRIASKLRCGSAAHESTKLLGNWFGVGSNMDALIVSLLQSCAEGNPDLLESCLQYGLDLNFVTEDGLTPLMYAVTYAGNTQGGSYSRIVYMLLEAGSDPNIQDSHYGRTAGHYAAHCKQSDILELLMECGSDVTICDIEGQSTFHLAITNGLEKCVELMVETIPALVNYTTQSGTAPLYLAAKAGSYKLCQKFLAFECDPYVIDPLTLQSPLHAAAEQGHASIAGLLLKKEQSVLDATDARGLTPVHLAASNVSSSLVLSAICDLVGSDVLELTDASGLTPLMHACASGSETCVEFIVKKKANLMAKDSSEGKTCLHWAAESVIASSDIISLLCKKRKGLVTELDVHGRIPLHSAATSGNVGAIKSLLDHGSDISAVDNDQYTPMHWAVASGQPEALNELISHGATLDVVEKNGATPLHLAAQVSAPISGIDDDEALNISNGAKQCIEILLKAGANVLAADGEGRQPLHWALQLQDNTDAVDLLISGGTNPNTKVTDGLPGLHIAAKYGITENCRHLIEVHGVDGNTIDDYGQTPLFYAIESQAIDCSAYLLSIGCSANDKNNEGRSPVHIAATVGSIEGLELLSSYNGDINIQSNQCITPLHDAAVNGQTSALMYILSAGGNPSPVSPDTSVPSPLHYAVSEGYKDCAQILIEAGANVNAFIITEKDESPLTPLDYATDYPEIKELLLSNNALPGKDIDVPKPEGEEEAHVEEEEIATEEATEPVTEEEPPELRPITTPTLRQQVSRESLDPFKEVQKPKERKSLLSRLMRRDRPPPDSIKYSVVGLYGAQATMLAAGLLGTPLGDKAFKVAAQVTTDNAAELKREAADMDTDALQELDWLETPIPEPSPSPVPIEIPPTPQPTPPPKVDFHMSPDERRMRKAKAQMDESKSLAFRAIEELLKAQNTRSQLTRRFVMAELKDSLAARREKARNAEEKARAESEKLLAKYNEQMEKAAAQSEKMNSRVAEQINSARKINSEIAHSMSALGISSRPSVSEWLRKKDEEKKEQLKFKLHDWHKSREQRELAISLKQAVTTHRALHHAAWNTKKELTAQNDALKKRELTTGGTTRHHKRAATTGGISLKSPPPPSLLGHRQTVTQNLARTRKVVSTPSKTITTEGCIRATPIGFLKARDTSPLPLSSGKLIRRSSDSLADSTLWKMGESYIGHKTRFHSGINSRAYGPRTVHAESTLNFVPPNEYKARMRTRSKSPQQSQADHHSLAATLVPAQSSRVQYSSHAEGMKNKRRTLSPPQPDKILPMKIIDQPFSVTV